MPPRLPTTAGAVRLPDRPMRDSGPQFAARRIALGPVRATGLPVFVCDEFRVGAHPFAPHPHAGLAAATYVLPGSPGGLRSRDSLGNDLCVGPGGIVWLQAGSGVQHEEMPSTPGLVLHGLQVFVELPPPWRDAPPQLLHLDGPDVPQWRGPAGDCVRVLTGRYGDTLSPLQPPPGLRWLDLALLSALQVDLPPAHGLLAHVLDGQIQLRHGGAELSLSAGQGAALAGTGAALALRAVTPARLVLLSGPVLDRDRPPALS